MTNTIPSDSPQRTPTVLSEILKMFDEFQSGFVYVGGSDRADLMRESYKRRAKKAIQQYIAEIIPRKLNGEYDDETGRSQFFENGYNQAITDMRKRANLKDGGSSGT